MVEVNEFGQVIPDSTETLNLNSQPYYIIEIGSSYAEDNHHYFILLAYNANPVFIQVGKFPILRPAINNEREKIEIPENPVSRRLGTFRDVTCKQLMEQENLRITVRNHFGKLIITFSGYEGTPWIVSRTDYEKKITATGTESKSDVPVTPELKSVSMYVPATPIQIGAGNMKVGFLYGPLHYEASVSFSLPNAITVKGPIEENEVFLWLGERGNVKSSEGKKLLYYQDAEVYAEHWGGQQTIRPKSTTSCPWPDKSGKDPNDPATALLKKSYISIVKATPLLSTDPSTDKPSTGVPGAGQVVKWFNATFQMGAGDASCKSTIYPTLSNANWKICNCITPLATGWKMYVSPSKIGHNQKPIDVAHHVETFSHSWSYTDNAKLEHTGSIKFRINPGGASSLEDSGSSPRPNYDEDGDGVNNYNTPPKDAIKDEGKLLSSLTNKMFFVRVYAWWEGGYMECTKNSCPCRRPTGTAANDANKVIFTGFAFGGDITVDAGGMRYMECQLFDYMKIMQDQYFINSPFFDGMSDYWAVTQIAEMAGFSIPKLGSDPFSSREFMNQIAFDSVGKTDPWAQSYPVTGQQLMFLNYTLPSSFDLLQNPFMKFADGSKFDEALSKIGSIAGKVAYFDRFGAFRYDIRPDTLFLEGAAAKARKAKCNFITSPRDVGSCSNLDLLALKAYSYKRNIESMVNDILLVTATPEGAVLVKSELNLAGRYDPTQPGWIGYTKRLMQIDGIFGNEKGLESVAKYYKSIVFKPPLVLSWESIGCSHLQAMDIVTFTGLPEDDTFPLKNVEDTSLDRNSVSLILTSVSGEIDAINKKWQNRYEGEWLYGNVADIPTRTQTPPQ